MPLISRQARHLRTDNYREVPLALVAFHITAILAASIFAFSVAPKEQKTPPEFSLAPIHTVIDSKDRSIDIRFMKHPDLRGKKGIVLF